MIDRAGIQALIPHAGNMCLLDQVTRWDDYSIRCVSLSHRDPSNPLVEAGRLSAVCGVEYAAQAMAVHGGLVGAVSGNPKLGYLASVRALIFEIERLDNLEGELVIEAEQLAGEGAHVIYRFVLSNAGRQLLQGRAAVVLEISQP